MARFILPLLGAATTLLTFSFTAKADTQTV